MIAIEREALAAFSRFLVDGVGVILASFPIDRFF